MSCIGILALPIRLQQCKNCIPGMHKVKLWRFLIASALRRAGNKLGYSKFRSQQERVVKVFVPGWDVFVSLQSGRSKSLCCCLLPSVFDTLCRIKGKSIVIVVSPLISLMKDQVWAMSARDIRAVCIGNCTEDDRELMNVCSGEYQLEPEALLMNEQYLLH